MRPRIDPARAPRGRLTPAVAQTRRAVRSMLARFFEQDQVGGAPPPTAEPSGVPHAPLVLVALSGGADSLALAAATAFEAPRAGLRAGAVVVDHGLQAGSAEVAERAAEQARALGLSPVLVRRVEVERDGDGPESAARRARYGALESARVAARAEAVLTAHTLNDQAEQVLLALGRGSGVRSIAGIPAIRGATLRPFLALDRTTIEQACRDQGLEPWSDPHNSDPAYTRVRVRERVLPMLERELGPGVSAALARSAELASEDADALDALAAEIVERALIDRSPATDGAADGSMRIRVSEISGLPGALRQRVIRAVAGEYFGAYLSRTHTLAIAELVTGWRGQGPINVPGVTVSREGAALLFERARL